MLKSKIIGKLTVSLLLVCVLFVSVACNASVITEARKGYAYTEILESNGAFVYNGRRYESLAAVVDSISGSGTEQTVSVQLTGDVIGRGVSIPKGILINIDLEGHKIKFIDVDSSALHVNEGAGLSVSNGTLTLNSGKEGLAVIATDGAKSIEVENVNVSSEAGQKALDLKNTDSALLSGNTKIIGDITSSASNIRSKENVVVDGNLTASDGTILDVEGSLSDVRVKDNSTLRVIGNGEAVVKECSPNASFVLSPGGHIVDRTPESISLDNLQSGICYIERDGVKSYFGDLAAAVGTLKGDNEEIVFFDNQNEPSGADIVIRKPVRINLGEKSVNEANNLILSDGASVSIIGNAGTSLFTGTVSSEDGSDSSLTLSGVEITGAVDISGTLTASDSFFDSTVSANIVRADNSSRFDGNINGTSVVSLKNSYVGCNTTGSSALVISAEAVVLVDSAVKAEEVNGGLVGISNLSEGSEIKNLFAQDLDLSASDDKLTVDKAVVSGANESKVSGGTFGSFVYSGTDNGTLLISGGDYPDFNDNGQSGTTISLTGGRFAIRGTVSNPNLDKLSRFLGYVADGGKITVDYIPSGLIPLSGNYAFSVGSGKNAVLNFAALTGSDDELICGLIVNSGAVANITLPTGSDSSVNGGFFVKLGGSIKSNRDMNNNQSQVVWKLTAAGKQSDSVEKNGTGTIVYKPMVDVVFRAVGDENSTKHDTRKAFSYNTAVTLPAATTLGTDFDRTNQKIDGWSTSSGSNRTKTYDDGATNVKFTEDTELYAVWKSKIIPSGLVEVPSKHAIVASCMLFDENGNELQSVPNGGTTERWLDETYFYLNTTANTVKVRGVQNPPELGYKEEYTIVAEGTVTTDDMSDPYFMGLEVIKAIGNMNHSSGNLDYYFFDKGDWKGFKFSRQGSTWDSTATEISYFEDARLTVRITIDGTLPTFPAP